MTVLAVRNDVVGGFWTEAGSVNVAAPEVRYSRTVSFCSPKMNIVDPSDLKNMPLGITSVPPKANNLVKDAVEMSQAVLNVYSLTSSPMVPMTNIAKPSGLKVIEVGAVSSVATENSCKKVAVLISQAVLKVYSFISLPVSPDMYILVPSGLKNSPDGRES